MDNTFKTLTHQLLDAGFSILPCNPDKSPQVRTWKTYQTQHMTHNQCSQLFNNGTRIGIIGGAISGNLECIDVDDPTVLESFFDLLDLRKPGLREKLTLMERTPRGGAHIIYRSEGKVAGNLKLAMDSTGEKVRIETRGEGGYFVAAPSPGYELLSGDFLSCPVLSAAEVKAIHETAKAFDLKKQTNQQQKGKNETRSRLVGSSPGDQYNADHDINDILREHGWCPGRRTTAGEGWTRPGKKNGTSGVLLNETGNFYVWSSNASPLEAGRSYSAFALYAMYEYGGDFRKAARSLLRGKKAIQGIINQDDDEVPEYIIELNTKHAVVMVGGQCRILNTDTFDYRGHPDISLSSVGDFHNRYANRQVLTPNKKGELVQKQASKMWMESVHRREYSRIVFDPSGKAAQNEYNLWQGFSVTPIQGDWSLMKNHIFFVICCGDKRIFRWVMAWLARIVQDPGGAKPGTGIVLVGKQGTGKGIFVREYGKLFGKHFNHFSSSTSATNKFNFQLKDCLVAFFDEAFWAGNKADIGTLKRMITEPTLIIEPKGKDSFEVTNHLNIIFASNNSWAVPADLEERRFCVLRVSPEKMKNTHYFGEIQQQMDSGGREAMLYDLINMDITGINLRHAPATEELFNQKLQSMTTIQKFYCDILSKGVNDKSRISSNSYNESGMGWTDWVYADDFYDEFITYANKHGDRYPGGYNWFGRQLKELCGDTLKKGKEKLSEMAPDQKNRRAKYHFETLDRCRKRFCEVVEYDVPWDDDDE